jgi:tetratricopeptide (TPR) repeat protein
MAAVGLALGLLGAAVPGQGKVGEANEPERKQLEEQLADLNRQVAGLYQKRRLDEAIRLQERALDLCGKLYPPGKYADGHPHLASSLNNLGFLLQARGEYARAEPSYRDALAMNRALYPRGKYPDGHPYLAFSLNNLGALLMERGEYVQAEPFLRDGLAMRRKLYPPGKYPDGHPDLATSLHNLGGLLSARGEYAKAEPFYRDALAMFQKVYPIGRYPNGHPALAQSLNALGFLLKARGEYAQAEPFFRDALAMRQKLFPKGQYPDGHPELATSLNNLGALLKARGEYAQAEPFYRDALAMFQKLYPSGRYPNGHPALAQSVSNLGGLLQARGEYAQAEHLYRDALAKYRKLYPPDKYPGGHPNLANSLSNLGSLLQARGEYARAEPFYRDGLDMDRRLYPEGQYPDGHPHLAASLNNLGLRLQERGEYAKAEPFYRDALAMHRTLYPKGAYPDGHDDLAASLNNLGSLLKERGEYARAEPFLRDAVAMCQKLYPPGKYPDGHPHLAQSLHNLGGLLQGRGEYARAEPFYQGALAMRHKLYPGGKYPDGHPDLAQSLSDMGFLLEARREYAQAEPFFRDALAVYRTLYPPGKYPDGHPDLATSLHNLGFLLKAQGEYIKAEPFLRDALAMRHMLYPPQKYPEGHPELARSLNSVGGLLEARGEYARAEPFCREGLVMSQRLTASFADTSAEAESLNYLRQTYLDESRSLFLSVTGNVVRRSGDNTYKVLWQGKAALARALERRQHLLRQIDDDKVRGKLQELLDARRQLARLILGLDKQQKGRDARLQQLTQRKEDLEKELAAKVPALKDAQALPTDLADHLPEDAAFVDLYRHLHLPKGENQWRPYYVAFVLRKGQPVRRVELGRAQPIEQALAAWRQAIAEGLDSPAAAELRKLVWDKLAAHLRDKEGSAVYLCPDADLSALPWAALPGRAKGTVLLENHALALVPHGPFLLQRLRDQGKPDGKGTLLAVGGVRYDRPADAFRQPEDVADLRPANRSGKQGAWPELPGTAREAQQVIALAKALKTPPAIIARSGTAAGPGQLLVDLERARWAHLATHGFFAAPQSDTRKYLYDEKDFLTGPKGERVGAGARSPLTQTGLVPAGANLTGQDAGADGGILTAEALAGLDLRKLELAVLSACETGLGEAASGEGVFGLQRAFHLGGCRNVLASLWKVDDDATAALMAVFYHELWVEGRPPLEALRRAQLALYHHPRDVLALARGRGPDFDQTVRRVTQPPPQPAVRAAVKDWAAFVLSGPGW